MVHVFQNEAPQKHFVGILTTSIIQALTYSHKNSISIFKYLFSAVAMCSVLNSAPRSAALTSFHGFALKINKFLPVCM